MSIPSVFFLTNSTQKSDSSSSTCDCCDNRAVHQLHTGFLAIASFETHDFTLQLTWGTEKWPTITSHLSSCWIAIAITGYHLDPSHPFPAFSGFSVIEVIEDSISQHVLTAASWAPRCSIQLLVSTAAAQRSKAAHARAERPWRPWRPWPWAPAGWVNLVNPHWWLSHRIRMSAIYGLPFTINIPQSC